jgi:hypothetical protein
VCCCAQSYTSGHFSLNVISRLLLEARRLGVLLSGPRTREHCSPRSACPPPLAVALLVVTYHPSYSSAFNPVILLVVPMTSGLVSREVYVMRVWCCGVDRLPEDSVFSYVHLMFIILYMFSMI